MAEYGVVLAVVTLAVVASLTLLVGQHPRRVREHRRHPPRMIRDLYTSLTAREQRAIRWSAAATAAALWLCDRVGRSALPADRPARRRPASGSTAAAIATSPPPTIPTGISRAVSRRPSGRRTNAAYSCSRLFGVAAQDRARVDRGEHVLGEVGLDRLAALARDAELPAEQRLGGGRAEADEHPRLDRRELAVEPRPAGVDLRPVRLLVDPPLAARRPT